MKTKNVSIPTFFLVIFKILFAQAQTLFEYKKYVSYDKTTIIQSDQRITYADYNYRSNTALDSYNNNYAKLKLFIKYGKCNHKLTKPFVFVEGVSFDKKSIREGSYSLFDYFEMRNGDSQESYHPLLEAVRDLNKLPPSSYYDGTISNYEVGYSTFNWATLVTGVDAEGVEDGEPLQVQKSPELLQKLYENGYDIVFVDFESGQQYMENNGFALSKALKLIKDSLDNNESLEKLVVCGASMGGLVSRIAIRDLELNGGANYSICVRKFISFDVSKMVLI